MSAGRRILVVGAGVAGLTAARTLARQGYEVRVAEQARRPGGRVATRCVQDGEASSPALAELAFDHGAQYVTARDARFAEEVEAWHRSRVVQVWHGKLAAFDSEGREAVDDAHTRWVGVPDMRAIPAHLARGLDLVCGVAVAALIETDDAPRRWVAHAAGGDDIGTFDGVIVAVPPARALPLLAASPSLATAVGAVSSAPCWATLVAFDDRVRTPFDGAFVSSSPLAWIARDRSKPRRGLAETWVLHASAPWSAAHASDDEDAVGPFLLNAFADLVRSPLPRPSHVSTWRWREACADPPLGVGALVDPSRRLVACGDWCLGNRVEAAYLSGIEAGFRLQASGFGQA